METTRLSSKGQIIIPQAIREAHHWKPGIEFDVQDTEAGILLTPHSPFKKTTLDAVASCVNYRGHKKTLKNMEEAIAKGVKSSR
jgi:AbrB family looped-hinge helix DNA binding protein